MLCGLSVLFIVYFRPKQKLYLVFEIIFEFLLLIFLIFMLTYVIIGGGTVTVMSIITHAVGFAMANSSLIIAIILNIMAYYTYMGADELHKKQMHEQRKQQNTIFSAISKQFSDATRSLEE